MKKLILNTFLGVISLTQISLKASCSEIGLNNSVVTKMKVMELKKSSETIIYMGFPIDKSFEASNGCIFRIKGEYTILTGNFVGTISIACPGSATKIYTFEFIRPSGGGNLVFVSGNEEAWNEYIANDSQLKSDIASYLGGL